MRAPLAIPALLVCLLAGACGSTPPHSDAGSAGQLQVAQLHVTLTVSGAVSGTATYTTSASNGSSCTQYAQGTTNPTQFDIPEGDNKTTIDGQVFQIGVVADTGWHGPGSYPNLTFSDPEDMTVIVDQSSSNEPFQPTPGATQSLTVNTNGSGSFTFTNWQDAGQRSETGTESRTCQDVTG
jgi:hypothetical protein